MSPARNITPEAQIPARWQAFAASLAHVSPNGRGVALRAFKAGLDLDALELVNFRPSTGAGPVLTFTGDDLLNGRAIVRPPIDLPPAWEEIARTADQLSPWGRQAAELAFLKGLEPDDYEGAAANPTQPQALSLTFRTPSGAVFVTAEDCSLFLSFKHKGGAS